MPLEPQAALEVAAVNLIRSTLGYREEQCDRTGGEEPPPVAGDVYVGVWSDLTRTATGRQALDEEFGLKVTVTLRLRRPGDRRPADRDDLEARANALRALLHRDSLDHRLANAANDLMARSVPPGATTPVGFTLGLAFLGLGPCREVGGEWFRAGTGSRAGLTCTLRFGGARLIQYTLTAS